MTLFSKIAGRVRGMTAGNYAENREDEQFTMNNRGDQTIVQSLPERTELVRLGRSYYCAGTAVSCVTTMPTTTAHLSLWNGEPDSGASYVIDAVGFSHTSINTVPQIVSAMTIGVQLNLVKIAMPTGTSTIVSLSGRANYGGRGQVKGSLTVTNSGAWHMVGNSLITAATVIGLQNVEKEVLGRYIVPPSGMFSVAVLGSNICVGSAYTPWIIWHEVNLILG